MAESQDLQCRFMPFQVCIPLLYCHKGAIGSFARCDGIDALTLSTRGVEHASRVASSATLGPNR